MSPVAVRRVLWIALVLALPVPIVMLGPGRLPPAHPAEPGAAALAFGLAESLRGVVGWTALIFLAQALLYAGALWIVAALVVRALGRARAVALALAAVLVVAACAWPVYDTPYHARLARATLIEVYR